MTKYNKILFKELESAEETTIYPFPVLRFTKEELVELNELANTFKNLGEAFGTNIGKNLIGWAQHYVTDYETMREDEEFPKTRQLDEKLPIKKKNKPWSSSRELTIYDFEKGVELDDSLPLKEIKFSKSGNWVKLIQKSSEYDSNRIPITREKNLFDMEDDMPSIEYSKFCRMVENKLDEVVDFDFEGRLVGSNFYKHDYKYFPITLLDEVLGDGELDKILDGLDLYL